MSSDQDLVVATVREILAGHPAGPLADDRRWDPELWADLVDAGLTGVGLPESSGGSGGELADAVAVVATLAAGAGAVPVAEQLLVAGPALLAAGLPLPPVHEPLSVAVDGAVRASRDGDGWTLTGTATEVAWAGVAGWLVVVAAGPDGAGSDGDGSDGDGSDGGGSDGDGSDGAGTGGAGTGGAGTGGGVTAGNGSDGAGTGGAGSDGAGTGGGVTAGNGSDGAGSDGAGSDSAGSDGGVVAGGVVACAGPDGTGGDVLALVDVSGLEATHAANLAGEPRGSYVFDGTPALVGPLGDLRARYALARAVQLSAALEQVLTMTVRYAGERVQFGRPLAKFQGIQMQLAEMAGEVTAVSALVDAAVQRLDRGEPVELAAAAAKVRAGAAVEVVARLAHQVHGAIGFTQEHALHHLTTRLWSWRDEAGSELVWAGVLGAAVAGDDPWETLTGLV